MLGVAAKEHAAHRFDPNQCGHSPGDSLAAARNGNIDTICRIARQSRCQAVSPAASSERRYMAIAVNPRHYAELFIGGEWVAPHSGRMIASIDPATEDVWALVAEADDVDVDRAVDAAREALRGPWARLTPSARGALIHKLGTLLARDARALAEIESRD